MDMDAEYEVKLQEVVKAAVKEAFAESGVGANEDIKMLQEKLEKVRAERNELRERVQELTRRVTGLATENSRLVQDFVKEKEHRERLDKDKDALTSANQKLFLELGEAKKKLEQIKEQFGKLEF